VPDYFILKSQQSQKKTGGYFLEEHGNASFNISSLRQTDVIERNKN